MQFDRRLGGADRRRGAQQYGPRVQPRLHLHDAHTRFNVARHDRPMDRRGPPPSGQQTRVDIQTPGFRRIQNGLGQDQTIGHNNSHIRAERCKLRLRFGGFQRNGVTYQ